MRPRLPEDIEVEALLCEREGMMYDAEYYWEKYWKAKSYWEEKVRFI